MWSEAAATAMEQEAVRLETDLRRTLYDLHESLEQHDMKKLEYLECSLGLEYEKKKNEKLQEELSYWRNRKHIAEKGGVVMSSRGGKLDTECDRLNVETNELGRRALGLGSRLDELEKEIEYYTRKRRRMARNRRSVESHARRYGTSARLVNSAIPQ